MPTLVYLHVLFLKVPFVQAVRRHIPKDHELDTAVVTLKTSLVDVLQGCTPQQQGVDVEMRLTNLEHNHYT